MAAPLLGDWQPSDSCSWVTKYYEGLPHVLPDFGRKHELTMMCWCHPVLDLNKPTIAHNVAQ